MRLRLTRDKNVRVVGKWYRENVDTLSIGVALSRKYTSALWDICRVLLDLGKQRRREK